MANTWGSLTWNVGNWGSQANTTVSVTGLALNAGVLGENLLPRSENIISGSGAWSATRTTVSKGVAAPNGTSEASSVIPSNDNNTHRLDAFLSSGGSGTGGGLMTTGESYTFSIFAKSAGYDFINLTIDETSNNPISNTAVFNLSTGAVASTGSGITSSITDIGDGWYRCRISRAFTMKNDPFSNRVLIGVMESATTVSFVGDTTSGVHVWGGQLEEGTTLTSYQYTSRQPLSSSLSVTSTVDFGWGRLSWGENAWGEQGDVVLTGLALSTSLGNESTTIDVAPVPTGIETSSTLLGTNFTIFSEDLSQSNYTKRGNATATANHGISPFGTKTTTLISNIQGNNTPGGTYSDIFDVVTTNYSTSGQPLEASFYIKRVSGSSTALQFNNPHNAAQGNWNIDFNSLSTTEFTRIDKNHSAVTVVNTYQSSGSGQAGVHFKVDASSSANLSFEVWGIQIEEGTAVTSYKKTTDTALNSILSTEASFEAIPTGFGLTSSLGTADAGPDAMATGNQATMATGTVEAYNQEGWGRYFWGLFEYGATGEWEFVTPTSLPLTATLGNETVTADANVSITGIALSSTLGTVDPSPDATVTGIGFSASLAVGSVITGTADVTVTGIGMPMGLGTGQLDAVSLIDVTGISMSVTLNSVTTKGFANVSLTGFALTSTLNNANTLIWNEIDTGSAPVWTEVPTRAA